MLPEGRAIDVRHPDLRTDPIGTAEKIYGALGLDFEGGAREGIVTNLEARKRATSGKHHHSLAGFGLDRDQVRERLAGYCEEVDV